MEIWKDIWGYTGYYQVSNMGKIKRLSGFCRIRNGIMRKVPEKVLKPGVNEWGYLYVILWKNGKGKMKKVHRLVALAFIPKVKGKPIIDHRFGNKSDNRVSELRWVTQSENLKAAYDLGLRKPKKYKK